MKKKILFAWLMLLMAMMACLVACGGDSASETIAPQTTAAVPETTVTSEIPEEPEVVVTAPLAFFSTGSQGSSHQDGHVFSCGDDIYIIDGGGNEQGEGTLYQYLLDLYKKKYGTVTYSEGNKLDLNLILSHFHGDHINVYVKDKDETRGALLKDPRFNVVSAYYPDLVHSGGTPISMRISFEEALEKYHPHCEKHAVGFSQYVEIVAGDLKFELFTSPVDWSSKTAHDADAALSNLDYIVELYSAQKNASTAAENSNCMWTKVSYGKYTMLFTGDVLKKGSYAYDGNEPFDFFLRYWGEEKGSDVFNVDILKYPHHGQYRTQAMSGVLDVMDPTFLLFTSLYKEYTTAIDTSVGLMYQGAYSGTCEEGILFRFDTDGTVDVTEMKKNVNKALYHADGTLANVGDLFGENRYATDVVELAGEGTEESPYLISTSGDLAFFAKHHADDRYVGRCFKLTNDIIWEGKTASLLASSKVTGMDGEGNVSWSKKLGITSNWIPIGSYCLGAKPFTGTFDGAGFSVMGIYCEGKLGVGFFGAVNGTVKNLTIKHSYFQGTRMVSAFVGHVGDGHTLNIENCVNEAVVVGKDGVGGIFGGYHLTELLPVTDDVAFTGHVNVIGCTNNGGVYGMDNVDDSCIGGIVGSLTKMGSSSITDCTNTGDVTSNGGCVGGILGKYDACALVFDNNTNEGEVSGKSDSDTVGALIGFCKMCYAAQ